MSVEQLLDDKDHQIKYLWHLYATHAVRTQRMMLLSLRLRETATNLKKCKTDYSMYQPLSNVDLNGSTHTSYHMYAFVLFAQRQKKTNKNKIKRAAQFTLISFNG